MGLESFATQIEKPTGNWRAVGISLGFHWDFIGISLGFTGDFMEICWNCLMPYETWFFLAGLNMTPLQLLNQHNMSLAELSVQESKPKNLRESIPSGNLWKITMLLMGKSTINGYF